MMTTKKIIAALFLVLIFARSGECLLAQEPAQVAIALIIKSEIKTLEKILDNQDKMLKRWDTSSDEYKNMVKKRENILTIMKTLRDELEKSEGLTHLTSDIDKALKERHPEWKANMTLDEVKKRYEDRQTKWKKTAEAYLRAMNVSQGLLAPNNEARAALFEILKKPQGQTQAIQALAGYFDHMNTMLTRNEQVIQGFMTAYAEYERDEMDERQDFGKATLEVCSTLKDFKPASKKVKLGF
ncbi:MAG: hypothetical protein IJ597_01495 [Synergistaceae bacterium]|nr:hypothetical protein [Synergistaceae bacterium]